jgi:hypothetical protein
MKKIKLIKSKSSTEYSKALEKLCENSLIIIIFFRVFNQRFTRAVQHHPQPYQIEKSEQPLPSSKSKTWKLNSITQIILRDCVDMRLLLP